MADWENDVPVVPVIVPSKKKWDDEDLDDEVKESWEDSGEEEDTTKKKAPGPIRNKIPREQRIAEREEKKKEAAKLESDDSDEDPIARKERLRKLELAADIQNAQDLFAGVAVTDVEPLEKLKLKTKEMKLKTKEDFDEFRSQFVDLIQTHQKSSFYATFLEAFTRELCIPLKDSEVRKISSTLSALANEKQKQQREAAKPKKKAAKPSLAKEGVKPSAKIVNNYAVPYGDDFDDDIDDDFDDFM